MGKVDRERLEKIHKEDTEKLIEVEKVAKEITARETQKIQDRYDSIKNTIRQLQEEKRELLRAPTTKEELLRVAKEEYHKHQKNIAINEILKPHFETCQKNPGLLPFDPLHIGLLFLPERDWRLAYFIFTDKDIEEAVALLPEIGTSEEERETKIKAIDRKIAQLSEQLEKEFKGK